MQIFESPPSISRRWKPSILHLSPPPLIYNPRSRSVAPSNLPSQDWSASTAYTGCKAARRAARACARLFLFLRNFAWICNFISHIGDVETREEVIFLLGRGRGREEGGESRWFGSIDKCYIFFYNEKFSQVTCLW